MHSLKEPHTYLPHLERLKKNYPHIKTWRLAIEKRENRHYTSDGVPWGWYEISPLQIPVGYWEQSRKSDLTKEQIDDWNAKAAQLLPTPPQQTNR